MVATGGVPPYMYALYDETGTQLIYNYQSDSVFSNLTQGNSYLAKTIDACGREFTQNFMYTMHQLQNFLYNQKQDVMVNLE